MIREIYSWILVNNGILVLVNHFLMERFMKLCFLIALLVLCGNIYAQKRQGHTDISEDLNKEPVSVWRERVIRSVYLPVTYDSYHRLTTNEYWYSVFQMLEKDGINGSIKCYDDVG